MIWVGPNCMTAQISDILRWEHEEWAICAIECEWPFHPSTAFGLQPEAHCTACWRGFFGFFGISENRLRLEELHVFLNEPGPVVEGIVGYEDLYGAVCYEGLVYPIGYSGRLLLGADFIDELYVHMGIQRPHCYRKVIELVCEDGVIVGRSDHGVLAEAVRLHRFGEKRSRAPTPLARGLSPFVREAFSLPQ